MILKNKTIVTIFMVMIIAFGLFVVQTPTINAQSPTAVKFGYVSKVAGLNEPWVFSIMPSGQYAMLTWGLDWSVYDAEPGSYIWPDAYLMAERPDGTTDIKEGPWQLDVMPTDIRGRYTFDTVGTWDITFVWPGDEFYGPATVKMTVEVQEEPIGKREATAFLLDPTPL